MGNVIELNPVDFVTIGTIGPKGKRTFHLQAGMDNRIVSFTIEKEQAHALSAAITEMMDDIEAQDEGKTEADFSQLDMELREPIEPLFRIAQMGLAYEANDNKIILVAQEMVPQADELPEDEDDIDDDSMSSMSLKSSMSSKIGKPRKPLTCSKAAMVNHRSCACGVRASKCAPSASTQWT